MGQTDSKASRWRTPDPRTQPISPNTVAKHSRRPRMAIRARGVKDGPLPTHYEARESPIFNRLYNVQYNPTVKDHKAPLNPVADPGDPRFPIIATTHRLTEHYLSGPMSRFNSWLNELQPKMFVELSPEWPKERNIEHDGWIIITRLGSRSKRAPW
jgi:anaerobic selenocysteine-containing dehydrogenase